MEILALIGHSGTGKSHQAPILAREYNIEYIVDDGLLIKGNTNLAGRSAKRENTRFAAIKRALFKDPDHARQVRNKLVELKPGRLLILSTSRRMADVIAANLGLPQPSSYFTIEEVSDPTSIKTALALRARENRHVIPLPTFAIKKEFPGYIIDPLRSFFSMPSSHPAGIPVERSVVRPVFSTLGSFYIAEHVITDMVEHIIATIPGVHKIMHIELENGKKKVTLNVDLSVDLATLPLRKIDSLLYEIQLTVKEDIEYLTGFYLDQVNVNARKLYLDPALAGDRAALREMLTGQSSGEM